MLCAHPAGVARPEHDSSPDDPVPRWSNTTRSRVPIAGAMFVAIFAANGIAAWPGPPARPITAEFVGLLAAGRRLMFSVIVPAAPPDGSSGTASGPHWKPAGLHGANGIAASAGVAIAPAAMRQTRPAR